MSRGETVLFLDAHAEFFRDPERLIVKSLLHGLFSSFN